MKKIKIIHSDPLCSFNSEWLTPVFDQYLEFEPWDADKTYVNGTLYYVNCLNIGAANVDQLINSGFKILIDNLWEVDPGYQIPAHTVTCNKWFWYNESLWYHHLGYDNYVPHRDLKYQALMPMNKKKPHRDMFLQQINTDGLLWSYCEAGKQLPNDHDMTDWNTQRYFNPEWYNQTYASMVVESLVNPGSKYTPIFITEKTTKPLAFQHPLMVYGNRGTIRTLRDWGFVTFDNLWDESYDEIVETKQRANAVAELLSSITIKDHDAETLRRLQHNKNHFFDRALVTHGIVQDIVEPILNHAETH